MPIYDVSLTGRDAYNGLFTKRFQVSSLDYPTAITDSAAMVADFEALCAGGVLRYAVSTVVNEDETPAAGSNRDEGLTFQLDLGSGKTASIKVPAPVKTAVQSDRSVDLTDVTVSNYLDNFIGGPFLVSDGETAVAAISGVLDK